MEMAGISVQICLALSIFYCISSSKADELTDDYGAIGICTQVGELCESNNQCCSSCCTCGLCLRSCEYDDNPCNGVDCGSGTCILEEAACIEPPCEPRPACMPGNYTDPCDTVKCIAGYICKPYKSKCFKGPCPSIGRCVPSDDDPCAEFECPTDTQCFVEPVTNTNTAECVPIPSGEGCKSQ